MIFSPFEGVLNCRLLWNGLPSSPLGKFKSEGILNGPLRTISTRSASKTCGDQRAGSVVGGTQVYIVTCWWTLNDRTCAFRGGGSLRICPLTAGWGLLIIRAWYCGVYRPARRLLLVCIFVLVTCFSLYISQNRPCINLEIRQKRIRIERDKIFKQRINI